MRLKNKNAISLIVLVITILVLAILATTVILNLSKTNIISEASDAVKKTELQQIEEAKTLMLADGMFGNNPEAQTIGDYTLIWNNVDKKVTAVANKNVERDGIIIPSGFGYVEGTKNTGLVIEDKDGNQFVWVPVDDYSTFKRGTAVETSSGSGIYKMTGSVSSFYTEPYASEYSTESSEYNAMCASVQKYGGFYIARFEAGDGDATYGTNGVDIGKRTAATTAHTVVSKKGAFVYNYVPWGESMSSIGTTGAVYLSQNMYKNHESVVSTLCYGVQWDAVMNFVSDAEHNIADSKSWGNYTDSTGAASANSGRDNMNYTTGRSEAWKAKNIYDLAGNVYEWTMEAYSSSDRRFYRGGYFGSSGSSESSSYRSSTSPINSGYYLGFRPTLYIKVIE